MSAYRVLPNRHVFPSRACLASLTVLLISSLALPRQAWAQQDQTASEAASQSTSTKYEHRGAWIATVINLDWPMSGSLPPRYQRDDLVAKLNKLKESGINTVYFQIRTEGDALYHSEIEPWSKYLTGKEGQAPDPYWDPLEFAIAEAHKRGMELHAWLNPYRAMRSVPSDFTQKARPKAPAEGAGEAWRDPVDEPAMSSVLPFINREYDRSFEYRMKGLATNERDSMHVANKHPEWLMVLNGAIAIFDPGLPEVMAYTRDIVLDVVNRYDVDGIHFDDYFYPYPPNHMGSSSANERLDDETFAAYPRGFTNKGDWRRNNVDLLVEMIHDSIQVAKPWVDFSISPFGIWKSGVPSGISGLNAYTTIYGDGIAWLDAQTIDYIVPQLYWRFGGGQDYAKLATWWAEQAASRGRHMYPGHGLYRTDRNTFTSGLFTSNEIPRQVRYNRANADIGGSVFFRAKNLTNYESQGFRDSLVTDLYRHAAISPVMAWKDQTPPPAPRNLRVEQDPETEYLFRLNWDSADWSGKLRKTSAGHADTLLKYAVYRVDAPSMPDPAAAMADGGNLVAVTGLTEFVDIAPPSQSQYWYFVTSVTRNSVESEPTTAEEGGAVVSNETDNSHGVPVEFELTQNYPNPFNPSTVLSFTLPQPGLARLSVYDVLGREVARLVDGPLSAGAHSVEFRAEGLGSGVYLYRLQSGGQAAVRMMTLTQ